MAKLHKEPYPGDWGLKSGESIKDYISRTSALADNIPWNRVMTFPVADGKACYFVVSEKPFILQHIPCGDAWCIPSAHMRGLTVADWRKQQKFREFFHSNKKI